MKIQCSNTNYGLDMCVMNENTHIWSGQFTFNKFHYSGSEAQQVGRRGCRLFSRTNFASLWSRPEDVISSVLGSVLCDHWPCSHWCQGDSLLLCDHFPWDQDGWQVFLLFIAQGTAWHPFLFTLDCEDACVGMHGWHALNVCPGDMFEDPPFFPLFLGLVCLGIPPKFTFSGVPYLGVCN